MPAARKAKAAAPKVGSTAKRPGSGSARGASEVALKQRIGRAIIAARGDMPQAELSRRTGIDQPTISKIEKGMRPTHLSIWEMEQIETATGRGPGFILRESGYLPRSLSTRQALAADAALGTESRVVLTAALDAAIALAATRDEVPAD